MISQYTERAMDALLQDRHRRVFEMRLAGLTYRKIAEHTNMSVSNAAIVFEKCLKKVANFASVLEVAEVNGGALDFPISELRHLSPKHGMRMHRATARSDLRGSTLRQIIALDPHYLLKLNEMGPLSALGFMDDMRRHFNKDKSLLRLTRLYQSRISKDIKSPIPHEVLDAIKIIREHGYSVSVNSKHHRARKGAA